MFTLKDRNDVGFLYKEMWVTPVWWDAAFMARDRLRERVLRFTCAEILSCADIWGGLNSGGPIIVYSKAEKMKGNEGQVCSVEEAGVLWRLASGSETAWSLSK